MPTFDRSTKEGSAAYMKDYRQRSQERKVVKKLLHPARQVFDRTTNVGIAAYMRDYRERKKQQQQQLNNMRPGLVTEKAQYQLEQMQPEAVTVRKALFHTQYENRKEYFN
jgi:hypothetical protein